MLFQYTRLDSNSIRLVRFLPYSSSTNIYLSLEHDSISPSQTIKYSVLSYSHDANPNLADAKKPITLSGRAFMIPNALHAALVGLWEFHHQTCESERLWIDVLCVNQRDLQERSGQMGLMGRTCERAERVVGWLGDGIGKVGSLESLLEKEAGARWTEENRAGLVWLMGQPYWNDAWAKAAISRGKSVQYLCGSLAIDSECLSRCIEWSQEEAAMPASDITQSFLMRNTSRNDRPGSARLQYLAFDKLLEEYSHCTVPEPRERIFAMLIDKRMNDFKTTRASPRIDYRVSLDTLAVQMILYHDTLCQDVSGSEVERKTDAKRFLSNLGTALSLPGDFDAWRSLLRKEYAASPSYDKREAQSGLCETPSGLLMSMLLGDQDVRAHV